MLVLERQVPYTHDVRRNLYLEGKWYERVSCDYRKDSNGKDVPVRKPRDSATLKFHDLLCGLVGHSVTRTTPTTEDLGRREQLQVEASSARVGLQREVLKVVYECAARQSKLSLTADESTQRPAASAASGGGPSSSKGSGTQAPAFASSALESTVLSATDLDAVGVHVRDILLSQAETGGWAENAVSAVQSATRFIKEGDAADLLKNIQEEVAKGMGKLSAQSNELKDAVNRVVNSTVKPAMENLVAGFKALLSKGEATFVTADDLANRKRDWTTAEQKVKTCRDESIAAVWADAKPMSTELSNLVKEEAKARAAYERAKRTFDSQTKWIVVDGDFVERMRDMLHSQKADTFSSSSLRLKNALTKLSSQTVSVGSLVATVLESLGTDLDVPTPTLASKTASTMGAGAILLDERAVTAMVTVEEEVRKYCRAAIRSTEEETLRVHLIDKHTAKFATAVATVYLHNSASDEVSSAQGSEADAGRRSATLHGRLHRTAQRARVALRVLARECARA
jgi:hypothetical protein